MDERSIYGEAALGRLGELPGGPELLAVAGEQGEIELVGGSVRDLLLGARPRELDVLVQGEVDAAAQALAALLDGGVTLHERFGTALVEAPGVRIDLAQARAESYAAPGALPDVRPGTLSEDLERRDFTVNAIAVALGGDRRGELRAVGHALEDLAAARLRVLHEGSFIDDPTRLLRLARYVARLGFAVEEHTAALAAQALSGEVLASVSGARVGAELRLALGEPDAPAALDELDRLGVLAALHGRLRFDVAVVRSALALLPAGDGRPDLLTLAALLASLTVPENGAQAVEARALLDRLQFQAGDRDRAVAAAGAVARLVGELPSASSPSAVRAAVLGVPPEGIALAGALGGPDCAKAAGRWLAEARHVRLRITGDDLLAAGVPAGPEIGRRLEAALALRLDGDLDDAPETQLRAALAVRV